MTIQQAFELALQHNRAGRLGEAETICRQILTAEPRHANALHLLGVITSEAGRYEVAVDLIRQALQIQPDFVQAHYNFGNALQALSRYEEAANAYRRAIQLQPDFAEALNNLGALLKNQGKLDEAIAAFQKAIELRPVLVPAHNNLGLALSDQLRLDDAIISYRRAIQLQPDIAATHYNLGNTLRDQGLFDEAITAYQRAIQLRSNYASAHNNLGNLLRQRGQFDEAEIAYRRGIELNPDHAELQNNLGTLLQDLGRLDEAMRCYQRATSLAPQFAGIQSNLLGVLQYGPQTTLASLFEAHCEFDRHLTAPLRASWKAFPNTPDPDRPLRIGMVSPHFAFHAVGYFLIRVLENLDRRQIEITGYSDTTVKDAMTARLRAAMTNWREVVTFSDDKLTELIREDRIDILFDLAGHTAGNRLPVFARKPAPIQITWLDYVGTTGMSAMDYIIGDAREIPAEAEPWYREKVLRMPDDYICYDPSVDAPPVGPLPALANGHVTFASFNIPSKTTLQIVRVWARILEALPHARMILKNRGFDDPETRARYLRIFAANGITAERVELRGWSPSREVLDSYNEVDIALDTFPYNGGLTTCESIWMGVPVVTCPGEIFSSRHGIAHLTSAGVPETVARDLDHYVEIAVKLASDLPHLAKLRAGLRQRVAGSPLCDGKRYADHFAVLLRGVWERWCRERNPSVP